MDYILTFQLWRRQVLRSQTLGLGLLLLTSCSFANAQSDPLPSWNEGPNKLVIISFVSEVTKEGGPNFVPASQRIATFDNDGTLWSEQPIYFQFAFALDRVKALGPQHPKWKTQQPFQGALEGDLKAVTASGEKGLAELIMATHTGIDFIDDGPGKPVGIQKFIGRRPILAFGNSDGDQQMLEWAAAGNGMKLMGLVHHTDATREWAYDRESKIGKLSSALDEATPRKWVVVDMKRDWKVVYPFEKDLGLNFHLNPWLRLTADLQCIRPVSGGVDTAVLPGCRLQLIFLIENCWTKEPRPAPLRRG